MVRYSVDDDDAFAHSITLYGGDRLLVADFLRPKTRYRFRATSVNAVGAAPPSAASVAVQTPSLVEYTIHQYFATRPPIEHAKATVLQVSVCNTRLAMYPYIHY